MIAFRYTTIFLVLLATCLASASRPLDKEPLRVTHRNSGPRYDIDESQDNENQVVPTRRFPPAEENPSQGEPDEASQPEHLTIRRIFLVPMMRPSMAFGEQPQQPSSIWTRGSNDQPGDLMSALFPGRVPNLMSSFMMGPQLIPPQKSPADLPAASEERPVESSPNNGGEREDAAPLRPVMDPLQMILDMMTQAVNAHSMAAAANQQPGGDLNKEAPGQQPQDNKPAGEESDKSSRGLDKKPASHNETREDIVEIEGKKFLRKTVTNRHVGENIIFMTKRLIFTPLNETDAEGTTQSTPSTTPVPSNDSAQPTSVSSTSQPIDSALATEIPKRPDVSTTSESAVSSETPSSTTSEPSSTTWAVPSEAPEVSSEASTRQPETEATTPKESLIERVSEAVEKVAERLVESSGTTSKPTESS